MTTLIISTTNTDNNLCLLTTVNRNNNYTSLGFSLMMIYISVQHTKLDFVVGLEVYITEIRD
jgi:hypothetical protein